jgi:hypothetical protein
MRKTLKQVIMERDSLTAEEADQQIADFKSDLEEILERGDLGDAEQLMQDYFGLEPDYLEDFLF